MRSKYVLINTFFAILNQCALAIVNLVLRRVLVQTLGVSYVGVDGLFSNILSLLGLVESGFGTAVIFSLYAPISQGDDKKIGALVSFYSKIYRSIAAAVLIIGTALIPLLTFMIKDNPFTNEETVVFYILFLINNAASYLLAYKTSFLMACQRQFWVSGTTMICNVIFTCLRIIVLLTTGSYVVFLVLLIVNTVTVNFVIAKIVDNKFSYVNANKNEILDKAEKESIKSNVKALLWHKVGSYVLNGTDNLVISYFIGIVAVGVYSNYVLITRTLTQFMNQLFNSIVPAMGDIIAEDKQTGGNKAYITYKSIYYLSFVIFGTSTIILSSLIQPFVKLWVGSENVASDVMALFLVVNFYFSGMRIVPSTTKSAAGIYKQDKFSPVCEAVLNLVISITLAKFIGVTGVIIGTLVSNLLMPFWTAPYFLYRDLFHKKFREYLWSSLKYLMITFTGVFILMYISNKIVTAENVWGFLMQLVFSVIYAVLYMLIFVCVSKDKDLLMPYLNRIWKRFKG